jgi:hypothetical protein
MIQVYNIDDIAHDDCSWCLNFFTTFVQYLNDSSLLSWHCLSTSERLKFIAGNCDANVPEGRKPRFEYGGCMPCHPSGSLVESNH